VINDRCFKINDQSFVALGGSFCAISSGMITDHACQYRAARSTGAGERSPFVVIVSAMITRRPGFGITHFG
jgi:hypothetical protein